MEITGTYLKTIFAASDSLYKVILVEVKGEGVTVVGDIPHVVEGLNYQFTGEFVETKYGRQFKIQNVAKATDTPLGLISFFAGDKFKGIGNKLAGAIVGKLGADAITKIQANPEVLKEVPGLTKAKQDSIVEELKTINILDDIFIKLAGFGLSKGMISRLIEKYDQNVLSIIEENPYRLIYEVNGFGFLKSDKLALSLGFSFDNPIRIREALLYTLNDECYNSGNTFILETSLLKEASILLESVEEAKVLAGLTSLKSSNRVVAIDSKVYPIHLYEAELKVATKLKDIWQTKVNEFKEGQLQEAIGKVSSKLSIEYTDLQKEALKKAFVNKITIITGGPGTGKTTLLKGILLLYSYLIDKDISSDAYKVLQVAPTGRAAKRMSESTKYGAATIHRALGYDYDGDFCFNEENQLPYDLIIVDETSMVDIELAASLLSATKKSTRLIFIGDENQLPSVGPGSFLRDIIAANLFTTIRLKEVMRQAKDSNIIKLANMVLHEKIDYRLFNERTEVYGYIGSHQEFYLRLQSLLDRYVTKNGGLEGIQVLIPMYAGVNGIDNCNKFIQEHYNHHKDKKINYGEKTFYLQDRVLQLQNNPELGIMNGDIGNIIDINDEEVVVNFSEKIVHLGKRDLDNLTLAYALSVHKSQGGEFPFVIMPLYKAYSIMLRKKLIYTAITRAKKALILVGDLELLESSLILREESRHSSLASMLLKEEKPKKMINDPLSAFSEIGEKLGSLTPYSFLTQ